MAKYGSTYGIRAAVTHFSKEFGKVLKEDTVRDCINAYNKELQRKHTLMKIGMT